MTKEEKKACELIQQHVDYIKSAESAGFGVTDYKREVINLMAFTGEVFGKSVQLKDGKVVIE